MKTLSLSGNAALVTGSSQGLGLGIARGLQESGASVVFHGHTARPPEIAETEHYVTGDLTDTDTIKHTCFSCGKLDSYSMV